MVNSNTVKPQETQFRTVTEAYLAMQELTKQLHEKEGVYYRPWQLAEHAVNISTLKTTYEEVFIWCNQHAMVRPGFRVEKDSVFMPNLFVKVSGVPSDMKRYQDNIQGLLELSNCVFYKKLPLYHRRDIKDVTEKYLSLLGQDGNLDKQKLLSSNLWPYHGLRMKLQESMAETITTFCRLPYYLKYRSISEIDPVHIRDRYNYFMKYANTPVSSNKEALTKVLIFEILCTLDNKLLDLLHAFDYPYSIPKIVLYHDTRKDSFTFFDAVVLMFMNFMGTDILVFTPSGKSDIEDYIHESYFDVHRLEKYKSISSYRSPSYVRLFTADRHRKRKQC